MLRSNKRLMIFPVLSGLASLLVIASFIVPLLLNLDKLQQFTEPPVWAYAVAFAFYFCTYFVIIFCNAPWSDCAMMRFNGEDADRRRRVRWRWPRLPQIFAWALVSATVGMLLKVIESAHEKVGDTSRGPRDRVVDHDVLRRPGAGGREDRAVRGRRAVGVAPEEDVGRGARSATSASGCSYSCCSSPCS